MGLVKKSKIKWNLWKKEERCFLVRLPLLENTPTHRRFWTTKHGREFLRQDKYLFCIFSRLFTEYVYVFLGFYQTSFHFHQYLWLVERECECV